MNEFEINERAVRALTDKFPFVDIEVCYDVRTMTYQVDAFDNKERIAFHEGAIHIYSEKYRAYELGDGREMVDLVNFLESYYNKKDHEPIADVECEPRALLCPSCGAAIKRGQLRCDYCMTEFVYR